MKQPAMNEYRSLMNSVDLPESVRENVMRAALAPDAQRAQPQPARRTSPRHPVVRGLAAGTCAVVLVAGLAFASGLVQLPNAPTHNGASVVPATGNFFTLAAYAAEQEGSNGQSATLALRNFGLGGGWSTGGLDVETGESHSDGDDPACIGDDGQAFAQVHYLLDLTCIGNNIQSVTYSIGGERVHFTRENWIYGPFSDEPMDFEQQDSFTIAYDQQEADKAEIQRNLVAYFPLNERGNEINALLSDNAEERWRIHESMGAKDGESVRIDPNEHPELMSNEEEKALRDELGRIVHRGFAELLAQAPLTLTATFTDGTTQTKSYLIAPVPEFDERYEAYIEERLKPWYEQNPEKAEPILYTITEITE